MVAIISPSNCSFLLAVGRRCLRPLGICRNGGSHVGARLRGSRPGGDQIALDDVCSMCVLRGGVVLNGDLDGFLSTTARLARADLFTY